MKFTPEVQAALDTLYQNAENDFERHRLDVLARDLTSPPVVEQADAKHQYFNGVLYNKGSDEYYSTCTALHRIVWQYYNGNIPSGYQIHHIDENRSNNNADNLACLPSSEHYKIHAGKKLKGKHLRIIQKTCKRCGKIFFGKSNMEYCSVECRYAQWRAKQYEKTTCEVCGKPFNRFKYNRGHCCSTKCAAELGRAAQQQRKFKASLSPYVQSTAPTTPANTTGD